MSRTRMPFTGANYQAVLDGLKDQTRRVMNPQPNERQAPYQPGDVLGIAVPHWRNNTGNPNPQIWDSVTQIVRVQDADQSPLSVVMAERITGVCEDRWHKNPAFLEPRWACLHEIEITAVRAERLGDISDEDCRREGIYLSTGSYYYPGCEEPFDTPRDAYQAEWESLNGEWDPSTWVWVIDYEMAKGEGEPLNADLAAGETLDEPRQPGGLLDHGRM